MGCDHQLLFPGAEALRSVALIPLRRNDRLQGSLNFGSKDEKRFSRHLATDFLAHLGCDRLVRDRERGESCAARAQRPDGFPDWLAQPPLSACALKEELARAQRQGSGLTCLLIDLDRFKQINDQYGHLAGDMALREAAQRVDAHIRDSDAAARFGGDEFVVLAPGHQSGAGGRARRAYPGGRVRDAAGDSGGHEPEPHGSIGVAGVVLDRNESDLKAAAERLLAEADAALVPRQAERPQSRRTCVSPSTLEPTLARLACYYFNAIHSHLRVVTAQHS